MILLREFANKKEWEVLQWWNDRLAVEVQDDFGEVLKTDTYSLMMSWYGLSIHRDYDKMPYSIHELCNTKIWNDKEFCKPIEYFLQQLMHVVSDPCEINRIKERIYEWQIKLNNFLSAFGEGGEISALAFDVTDVKNHPVVVSIQDRIISGDINIDEGEGEFKEFLLKNPDIENNTFAMLARTGAVSVNQGYQLVVTRGSVFDLNNQILPNPVVPGFAEGIANLADALGENRSAGKALISNGRALEDSEWFHRKLHITTSVVLDIKHQDDCGSTITVPMKITSSDMLRSMRGKYIVDADNKLVLLDNNTIKNFKRGDVIQMRSVVHCLSHETGKPCGVCYGKMSASIPYNTIMLKSANPGMFSATVIAERIGQALLSTKHFMRHTVTIPFVVRPIDKDLITTDGDYVYPVKDFCRKGTRLILDGIISNELSDLRNLETLDEINYDQLRTFDSVAIEYETEDLMVGGVGLTQRTVNTSVSSRSARMSRELIEYAIKKGWERDKKQLYIDLSEFNNDDPLFFLPYVHEDLDQYRRQIESFVSFSNRNPAWKRREVTPEIFGEVLTEMWELVNRKFAGINIVHSEVILYSLLTRDPDNGLYGLPAGDEPRYFSAFTHCINNRGMGSLLVYQKQPQVLESPDTYGIKERQATGYEGYFTPGVI